MGRRDACSGFLTSGSTVRGRKRSSKNPLSPISLSDGQITLNLPRPRQTQASDLDDESRTLPFFLSPRDNNPTDVQAKQRQGATALLPRR